MKAGRKALSVLLSVLIVLGAVAAGGMSAFADGNYLITDYNNLIEFSRRVNNGERNLNAILAKDIVLPNDTVFTPIGKQLEYTGTFDGCRHTITGLNLGDNNTSYQGLFGRIGSAGVVMNLGLIGGKVTASEYAGGIAGENGGTIKNCYNKNEIFASYSTAGGIAGENTGTIENCYNTGAVTSFRGGGIVSKNNGLIMYCYNAGKIQGTGASGIASYSGGTVYGYYDTEASGCSGAVNGSDAEHATGLSSIEMKGPNALDNMSYLSGSYWKATSGYPVLKWQEPDVTVNIDFGTSHETFVQNAFGSESSFSVSGAAISLTSYNILSAGDVMRLVINILNDKDEFRDGEMKLMTQLGLKPLSEYTADSLRNEDYSVGVTDGMTLYALWQQPAEVSVKIKVPPVGTEITFVNNNTAGGGHASPTTSPAPVITVLGNATLFRSPFHDNTDGFWCDNPFGSCNTSSPFIGYFTGTVEEGRCYYASFMLTPDLGYYIDKTTADYITVNSGVPIFIGSDSVTVTAELIARSPTKVEISDYSELKAFAARINSGEKNINAVLTADIDASMSDPEAPGYDSANAWTPIGNCDNEFTGTFDGLNHKITGLTFNDTTSDYAGLFGVVAEDGSVKNVGLEGSRITGKSTVGGVAGLVSDQSSISNCYNTGDVAATADNGYAGGVVGINKSAITNCYNTGSVSGIDYIGGVAGNNNGGTVINCYNTGNVSGYNSVGGVVGVNNGENGSVENCFYDSERITGIPAIGQESDATSTNVTGLKTDQMTGVAALRKLSGFSSDIWLTKANGKDFKYYPHLKGFNLDENSNQLDANSITAENWPAKAIASPVPRMRINEETNFWEVSYDGGNSWESLGVKATGEDGAGIAGISVNGNGELIITLTNGNEFNLGKIKGENGADGQNGQDGQDGKDGENGQDGKTPLLRINPDSNEWEVSYDDGATWTSLGIKATGESGQNGADGQDGQNGADGQNGQDGKDAPVITGMHFNENGELIVSMSDGTEFNAGKPSSGNLPEEKSAVSIAGYQAERNVSYGTSITFHAQVSNAPQGSEIHWFINGEDKGTGYVFTVENAKDGFNVCAKLIKDGSIVEESATEKVTVNNGFFNRIIAFLKKLFVPADFIIDQK